MTAGEAAVRMRMRRVARLSAGIAIAAGAAASSAIAGPLDLDDARPRSVLVRFENSPPDAPDRLAATYTAEIPARLTRDPATGHAEVRIAGRDVERGYFTRQRVREGSFSDYVWVFDPRTGHVVSASLRGTLIRRFAFGPVGRDVDTHFEATLSTLRDAGFGDARRILGQLVFPFCTGGETGCTLVRAARYDARTGYVNAVGAIGARALGVSARSFAAIGEAVFSEWTDPAPADYADAR